MTSEKVHLLFSSGKDSLLNLYNLVELGAKPTLHYINYGQKSYKKEVAGLKYYAKKFELPYTIDNLELTCPPQISKGSPDEGVGSSNVVLRNIIILSYLINKYQDKEVIQFWYYGAHKFRKGLYTDGVTSFMRKFSDLILGIEENICITSTISHLWDDEIMKTLAAKIDVDLSHIWFCDSDGNRSKGKFCGKCAKCAPILYDSKKYGYYELIKNYFTA